MSLLRAALLMGSAVTCTPASAQSNLTAGIVESPCPPTDTSGSELRSGLRSWTELFLEPGKTLGPEVLANLAKGHGFEAYAKAAREQRERDWPNLCRYKGANVALAGGPRPQVVFMGDSITENWALADPSFFTKGRIDRGIGGQTAPQMVLRFFADVIDLRPRVVHIMAGTNDIGGNTGPSTLQDYKNNILAMLDLAEAHHIAVVLAAVPPSRYLFLVRIDPRPRIAEINSWLQQVARQRRLIFVDYAAVLADKDRGMQDALSNDGIHPNRAGYAKMRPLAETAIARALHR